jgi:hypothetical protein
MWKIVVVLLLTALAILLARLAYDAPVIQTRVGALVSQTQGGVSAPVTPALMYAGVRG